MTAGGIVDKAELLRSKKVNGLDTLEAVAIARQEDGKTAMLIAIDGSEAPDVVMACCGDMPTLAPVSILREHLPALKIRVVDVVDLMRLQPHVEHPRGLDDADFDALTRDKPVIVAFHAYP